MPPAVVAELRRALLADLRSPSEDTNRFIGELERALQSPNHLTLAERRRAWVKATKAIQTRQRLHELVGWPSDPLHERTIFDPGCGALALSILTGHREATVAKLAANLVPEHERETDIRNVSLLTRFLKRAGCVELEPRFMGT